VLSVVAIGVDMTTHWDVTRRTGLKLPSISTSTRPLVSHYPAVHHRHILYFLLLVPLLLSAYAAGLLGDCAVTR